MPDGGGRTRAEELAVKAKRKKKTRNKNAAMEDEGFLKLPRDTWVKREAMEALYDFGEHLGVNLEDPDKKDEEAGVVGEIINRMCLGLGANPQISALLAKQINPRCPGDIGAADTVLKYSINSVFSRMMDEGK